MFTTPRIAARDETDRSKLRTYRAALVTEARALVERADAETRALTPADKLTFDALNTEVERVDDLTRQLEARTETLQAELRALIAGVSTTTPPETRARTSWLPSFSEYRDGLETRAVPPQNEANGTDGGYIVPVQTVGQIFDRLRAQAVFLAAGPRIVTMESMTAVLPIIGTSVTVAMVPENTDIPVSGMTFKAATLRAKKAAALAVGSSEWFLDSAPSARDVLAFDMERQMAAKIDEQSLVGDGTGENVLGLFNVAGVADTPAGGALTLDVILAALGAVEARGAQPTAIFMNPAGWAAISAQKDTGNAYLLNPVPSEALARRLFGVPVFVSPVVPVAQALVAAMNHVAFGWRQQIRINYDQGGKFFVADQTAVRAITRFDVGVLNLGALQKISGITVAAGVSEPVENPSGGAVSASSSGGGGSSASTVAPRRR